MRYLFTACLFLFALIISMSFSVDSNAYEKKAWTVYVHMNGDNNLCRFAALDMEEMKRIPHQNDMNLLVGFDCQGQGDSKLFLLRSGQFHPLDLVSPGEWDMGDWKLAAKLAKASFGAYESDHRMYVIWNHGAGVAYDGKSVQNKGVSYDDQSGNHISTKELGLLAKEVGPVDVIGFDACLMQMLEINYELAPYTKYVLASEDLEPGAGWDYEAFEALALGQDAVSSGKLIVDAFIKSAGPDEATLSLVDSSKVQEMVNFFKSNTKEFAKLKGSEVNALPNWYAQFVDIGELLSLAGMQDGLDIYNDLVIYSGANQPATGMSISFSRYPDAAYKNLKFVQETGWDKVVKAVWKQ